MKAGHLERALVYDEIAYYEHGHIDREVGPSMSNPSSSTSMDDFSVDPYTSTTSLSLSWIS